MATLSANDLNVSDIIRRSKPDGTEAMIAEMLAQENALVNDMAWVEGELPNGHQSVQRTSLPTFSTIQPNGTATASKSTTAESIESPEWITSFSNPDDLVLRYGGSIEWKRASEAVAFKQAAVQTISNRVIYGDGLTNPGRMTGIMLRYNDTTNVNGGNVILGGSLSGQTDNMSVLLLSHGRGMFYGWYPKGSGGGLEITDFGRRVSEESNALKVVYTTRWLWGFGIAVDDWRAVTRIGNIDLSLLIAGTGADLFDKLMQAVATQWPLVGGRKALYMNRTTKLMLDIQARNDVQAGGQLSYSVVSGQSIPTFMGIPINIEDTLTEAETRIT